MESRRLSAVCERKGSVLREREAKEGARASDFKEGLFSMEETEVGGGRGVVRARGICER